MFLVFNIINIHHHIHYVHLSVVTFHYSCIKNHIRLLLTLIMRRHHILIWVIGRVSVLTQHILLLILLILLWLRLWWRVIKTWLLEGWIRIKIIVFEFISLIFLLILWNSFSSSFFLIVILLLCEFIRGDLYFLAFHR